ncbi:MAG: PKD repeat protein [Myxococcota bacterium]
MQAARVGVLLVVVACGGGVDGSKAGADTATPTTATGTPGGTSTGATSSGSTTPTGTTSAGTTPAGSTPTGSGTTGCGDLHAVISASSLLGRVPFVASFDAATSCLPVPAASITWDFDDGLPPVEVDSVERTWLGSGTYTVTLKVVDEAGASSTDTAVIEVTGGECPLLDGYTTAGSLTHPDLNEASGLAVSRRAPDLLWTHNDNDDDPRLFAIGADGRDRGVFRLTEALVGDWEDIAVVVGPDTGVSTLYIGDIGDNGLSRDAIKVYWVDEPDPALMDQPEPQDLPWQGLQLDYPDDAALDGDSLMVDPQTGDLYIVARTEDDRTEVYRKPAPHVDGERADLEWVAEIPLGEAPYDGTDEATGASFSPLGDRFVVRTWDAAFLFLRDASRPVEEAFAVPCPLPVPVEPRGEAIAFDADGSGLFTVSEELYQPVWRAGFVEPPPPCSGLEARVLATPPTGPLPLTVTFAADPDCVPAGIAEVAWEIDGEATAELEPERTWLASGDVPVQLTVTDLDGATDTVDTVLRVLPGVCPTPDDALLWGRVESDQVIEASGVVHSAATPGVLWTHNDAGDDARLFAMSESGEPLGEYLIDGAPSRDWEDMSAGWDAHRGAYVLYVGDVGDNGESREFVSIVVVPEPVVPPPGEPVTEVLEDADVFELTYPGGVAHNCETVMTDPVTGDLYIVTKDGGGETSVFVKEAPHLADERTELVWVADLRFGEAPLVGSGATTGGDFSPDGSRVLIRTYSHAYMFIRDGAFPVADAFGGLACDLRAPDERQGEAAAFTADGSGYITVSEGLEQPIWYTPLE